MPAATVASVRQELARRTPAPVYLIVGDDDAEMTRLAAEIGELVEEELRPFNTERLYAGEKAVTPGTVVQAARMLPMMSDRRVVTVLRAEKMLKPRRRGKGAGAEPAEEPEGEAPTDLDVLDEYVRAPVPQTTLVLVAADVDRTRKIYKTLQKEAVIVECWGLKGGRDKLDLREAARRAEALVKGAVASSNQQIEPAAARLVAERAGTDIARLRGDLERLLLYTAGKAKITIEDARQIVSGETSQDDWAVTNAIAGGDGREALRQLSLALESGGVSYQILGQIAWFVRERLAGTDPRRVPGAVEALFRTDLELKSSGDARVLLERLVLELCRA